MGVVNKRKRIFFLFQNLSVVPKKSKPGKFAYIWHFQETGISVIQFEKTRIHFKSDFFAAVAVVDAKALYYREYLRVLKALIMESALSLNSYNLWH